MLTLSRQQPRVPWRATRPGDARGRWVPWAAILAGTLLLAPLSGKTKDALMVIGAVIVVSTAAKSIAIPLGFLGFAAPIVALVGHDPFPQKAVPLITFAWVALSMAITLRRDPSLSFRAALTSPLVVLNVALFALLLLRLPESTLKSYGDLKTELFLIGNLTLLAAGILLGSRSRDELDLFLFLTLVIDALSGGLILGQLGGSATLPNRFGLLDQSVISLGSQGVEGLMVAMYLILRARRRWMRMVAACVLPVTFVALLASGSRGPVLGGTLGLISLVILLGRSKQIVLRLVVVAALIAGSFTVAIQLVPSGAAHRALSTITGTQSGVSGNGRSEIWHAGWQAFANHPLLGIGTGSFATADREQLCPGPACSARYPHNMILEAAAELGVVGGLLVIAILFVSVRLLLQGWRSGGLRGEYTPILFALFVASAVDAMVTNDLTGHPSVWLMPGIALGLAMFEKRRGDARDEKTVSDPPEPLPSIGSRTA